MFFNVFFIFLKTAAFFSRQNCFLLFCFWTAAPYAKGECDLHLEEIQVSAENIKIKFNEI